jgi:hypothetical protein
MIDEPRDERQNEEWQSKGREGGSEGRRPASPSDREANPGTKRGARGSQPDDKRGNAEELDESLRDSRDGERGEVF